MSDLPLLVVGTAGVAVRAYAGMLLAVAGFAKLGDRSDFLRILAGYRLLPALLTAPAAQALPMIELLVGAALFVPAAAVLAAPVAAALLALFALAVAINLGRGRRALDCGCGTGARIGWPLVAGNLALAALLLATMSAPAPPLLLVASGAVLGIGLRLCRLVMATLAAMPSLVRRHA